MHKATKTTGFTSLKVGDQSADHNWDNYGVAGTCSSDGILDDSNRIIFYDVSRSRNFSRIVSSYCRLNLLQ